jgi:glucose-6-phosphate isomerase
MLRCDQTAAWVQLQSYYSAQGAGFDARTALRDDPQRVEKFSQSAPHVFADLSKNRIDDPAFSVGA